MREKFHCLKSVSDWPTPTYASEAGCTHVCICERKRNIVVSQIISCIDRHLTPDYDRRPLVHDLKLLVKECLLLLYPHRIVSSALKYVVKGHPYLQEFVGAALDLL